MQYTYLNIFFHCSEQFLKSSILMLFSASAIFLFHLFHLGKTFPFEDFFHLGKQKQSLGVRSGEQGGWGIGVMLILVKNCCTLSTVWASVLVNHPSWSEQPCAHSFFERIFKKNSLKLNTASHNNASWYTDTDGFLEHTQWGKPVLQGDKGPALQITPFFLGPPLIHTRVPVHTHIYKRETMNLLKFLNCYQATFPSVKWG